MTHVYYHAVSSARVFGGVWQDYEKIHAWFDASKSSIATFAHRAVRHHSEGIFLCQDYFGMTIVNSDGKHVPVRYIGEQHCLEDMGRIPSLSDWLSLIQPKPWMAKATLTTRHFTRRVE